MINGWVKIHRKLVDSRVFKNEGLLKVWIWCLLKANHEEEWVSAQTGRGETEVHLYPGQFIFGRKTASKALKMDTSTIRNRMEKLKNMQNLDIQPDTHYSIITIKNWDSYQTIKIKEDRQEDRQRTPKGQAKDRQEDTDKKYKNDKNDKNKKEIYKEKFPHLKDKSFQSIWIAWLEVRKKIKAPATERALELNLNKLHSFPLKTAIKMLEQSVERGYRGIFPLEEKKHGTSKKDGELHSEPGKFDNLPKTVIEMQGVR